MPRKYRSRMSRYKKRFGHGKTKYTRQSQWSSRVKKRIQKHSQHLSLYSSPGAGGVVQPFPPNLWTVLTYTVTRAYTTSGTVGVLAAPLQIRANSIYDPEVAVGGGQPRYTDSLLGADGSSAPYRHYRVHASAIKVRVWKGGSTYTDNDMLYVIPARSQVTAPSTENEAVERAYSKTVPCNALASGYPRTLKHYTKIKWHLGHKDLMDSDNTAAALGNPAEQVYWNIGIADIQQTGAAAHTANLQITVKYFVQFYTLTDVADS